MNTKEIFEQAVKLAFRDPRRFITLLARYVRPRSREYRKRFKMSLRQWLIYHHKEIVFRQCHWMGVKALKNPLDAWIYQEILYEVKPDVIIELGSAEGGSTLYFSHLLQLIGKGIVVSIDIDRSRYAVGHHDNIIPISGHTASPEVLNRVSEICTGKNAVVVHDADHRKVSVLRDLENYAKYVHVGSYIIVEDGIVDLFRPTDGFNFFEAGPLRAVEEFVKMNSDFVIDSSRERYIATYNPNGFLKRVK